MKTPIPSDEDFKAGLESLEQTMNVILQKLPVWLVAKLFLVSAIALYRGAGRFTLAQFIAEAAEVWFEKTGIAVQEVPSAKEKH